MIDENWVVLVNHDNLWKPICDDIFSITNAEVICNELGLVL